MIWLGLIVSLSWGSVGSVCEQSPMISLLRGHFSWLISLSVMALLWIVWELLPLRLNLAFLFAILIISRYCPNSALHALFGVLRCTRRLVLQNSSCSLNLVFVTFCEVLVGERTPDLTTIKGNGFYD